MWQGAVRFYTALVFTDNGSTSALLEWDGHMIVQTSLKMENSDMQGEPGCVAMGAGCDGFENLVSPRRHGHLQSLQKIKNTS